MARLCRLFKPYEIHAATSVDLFYSDIFAGAIERGVYIF